MIIPGLLGKIPFRMFLLDEFIFFGPFRFPDREEHNADSDKHQHGDENEQRLVIDV